MSNVLIVIPCGLAKIWDRYPDRGSTPARDAYTGSPFKVNRAYAERFADKWVILSAKYGFISPDFLIPEPYNVTFKRTATHPISVDELRKQVRDQGLNELDEFIGLGGKDYRVRIEAAFSPFGVTVCFPFAGLSLGVGMSAVKRAVAAGQRYPEG